jgi:hypothetical protein
MLQKYMGILYFSYGHQIISLYHKYMLHILRYVFEVAGSGAELNEHHKGKSNTCYAHKNVDYAYNVY